MKFEKDLRNYIIKETPPYIKEVNVHTIDFDSLSEEIEEFKKEIKWDEMWDVKDAKNRLLNNWRVVVFIPNQVIKGWIWLDNTNEPKNIYVNKEYRNSGIGKELYYEIHNICKKMNIDKIIGYIDNWNLGSRRCIESVGWYKISD
jgi:L-amino acid N-acyltransferase YncA